MKRPIALAVVMLTAALFLGLTGCVTNDESDNPEDRSEVKPAAVPELTKQVPADLRKREVLRIGTNPTFVPAEFKDSADFIIGFDIGLMRAMASVLDSWLEIQEQDFALILLVLPAGAVDIGASGFTSSEERRKIYGFVDYLDTGLQWARRPGSDASSNNYCGKVVVVQHNTVADMGDLPVKNQDCLDRGLPPINKLAYQDVGTAATTVVLGRADALATDPPVSAYAVNRSEGKLEFAGDVCDGTPFGFAIPKDSELGPVLQQVLQYFIGNDQYKQILTTRGLEDGALERATINRGEL